MNPKKRRLLTGDLGRTGIHNYKELSKVRPRLPERFGDPTADRVPSNRSPDWRAARARFPAFENLDSESKANPSRGGWEDQGYLEQQRSRLPSHKYRRLHLNLPGLPEGSAFSFEKIDAAVERNVKVRPPQPGIDYSAFVDMSGGSNNHRRRLRARSPPRRRQIRTVQRGDCVGL
jgi:hypothetical protein